MKSRKELKAIYDSLNDSEKHGVQFGLFPAKLLNAELDNIDCAKIMQYRMKVEKYDVNKH